MRTLNDLSGGAEFTTRSLHCHGCDNRCEVVRYDFKSGSRPYYSGNRCERVFCNGKEALEKGENAYEFKLKLLFSRAETHPSEARLRIGIPRVLGLYEDFPFWHALFSGCGLDVVLSDPSDFTRYEQTARLVMSDNICFPAKLVHAHMQDLSDKGVSRIFFPFVVRGPKDDGQNSYNCPLVSAYGEVIRNVQALDVPLDTPVFSMKDSSLFKRQCVRYLVSLGLNSADARRAFGQAVDAQRDYVQALVREEETILSRHAPLTIVLAGRPYHTDPLIQHNVSQMIAGMGVPVITDDIVRDKSVEAGEAHFLSQWSYPNRILKAARWVAAQGSEVQFVELTSFGCGPDAFLIDAVREILMHSGKSLTLLKLDDIDNTGSLKLRVRSLVESLRLTVPENRNNEGRFYRTTPVI